MRNAADRAGKAARDKAYAQKNNEKIAQYQKEYRAANKDKAKKYLLHYLRDRRANDPAFRLKQAVAQGLSRMLKGTVGKTRHLPYSMDELKKHIERQFQKGMTWENYGKWHVDHIRPVSSFSIDSPEHPDFLICWGLTNLRPLWAQENIEKKAKRLHLL